ncbi:hypothetical protein QYE76_027006 [Lolium multiflorum]|uniref:Pentatricopeptide repeat-containing protein n=1 Tax=Lolium multiflorum TaxID=4521 RepID=A0AAD8QG93_LOLMU|nr:hypothetical protein QYE76_027006 [Lolium multiflorum]
MPTHAHATLSISSPLSHTLQQRKEHTQSLPLSPTELLLWPPALPPLPLRPLAPPPPLPSSPCPHDLRRRGSPADSAHVVEAFGSTATAITYNALGDGYCRMGRLDEVCRVMDSMATSVVHHPRGSGQASSTGHRAWCY